MKVSIITPTYNSAHTLADTLNSVACQDYKNIEHFIVDGLSKDNTLEIAYSFPHLSTIISEPDKGIYDAMNKGIKQSNGEIIGILNSDDIYNNKNVLNYVMDVFKDKSIQAVYGDLNYVNYKGKIIRRWRSGEYNRELFLQGWMPPHPTFFIRRACYEKYGLYDIDFSISADYELMLRMLYKYNLKCIYIPEVLVSMLTGGQSNGSFRKRWIANREDRKAWVINELTPGRFTHLKKPLKKLIQYF